MQSQSSGNGNRKVKETPLDIFLEHVSVQGLHEIRRASNPFERIFWVLVILTVGSFFIRDACQLILEALVVHDRISYDWALIDKPNGLRLPNVTICTQTDFNMTRLGELFVIPEHVLQSKIAKERNLTKKILIEEMASYYAPHARERKVDSSVEYLLREILSDQANMEISSDYSAMIKALMPPCHTMLAQCSFNNQPFQCCDVAMLAVMEGYTCYKLQLDVENTSFIQKSPGPKFGVTVTAYLDAANVPLRNGEEDTVDGFMINVNEEATFLSEPIASWPGSHVQIQMSGRRKISTSKCKPNGMAHLKYFDHYDTVGAFCLAEYFYEKLWPFVGCQVPGYTYFPNSSLICDANILPLLGKANALGLETNWESMMKDYQKLTYAKNIVNRMNKIFGVMDPTSFLKLFHNSDICSSLCEHWDHRLDVSYSSLQNTSGSWESTITPTSLRMAQITVFYGELAYLEFKEQPFTEFYTVFYEIGGSAGLYAGASIVTFLQLLAFGIWCTGKNIKDRKRKTKVMPIKK